MCPIRHWCVAPDLVISRVTLPAVTGTSKVTEPSAAVERPV